MHQDEGREEGALVLHMSTYDTVSSSPLLHQTPPGPIHVKHHLTQFLQTLLHTPALTCTIQTFLFDRQFMSTKVNEQYLVNCRVDIF